MKKLQFLHNAAAKIVDELVVNKDMMDSTIQSMISAQEHQELLNRQELNNEGRFPCRFPGCSRSFKYNVKTRKKHELSHDPPLNVVNSETTSAMSINSPTSTSASTDVDDVFNYNTALLAEVLFFLNFLDSVCEGDGERILRQYKYLMLLCRADGAHSTKYALECLYQLLLVNGCLSESEAEVFTWNRTVNNRGGAGKNIPFDLEVEHSNNYIKQGINHLGANLTESTVSRVAKAEKPVREIIFKTDKSIQFACRPDFHVEHFPKTDFDAILKELVDMKVFEKKGCHYRHFNSFPRDPLKNLNMSQMYQWISKHKKKISSGSKAR